MRAHLSFLLAAFALTACAAPDPAPSRVPARVIAALPKDLSPRQVGQRPDGCWFYVVGGDAFVPLMDADGAPICT